MPELDAQDRDDLRREHVGEWEIQLHSATWRSPGDERELGVLVDWVEAR